MSWWVLSCSIWASFVLAQRGRLGRGDVLQLLWGICSASLFLHFILHVDPGFKVQPPHRMHRDARLYSNRSNVLCTSHCLRLAHSCCTARLTCIFSSCCLFLHMAEAQRGAVKGVLSAVCIDRAGVMCTTSAARTCASAHVTSSGTWLAGGKHSRCGTLSSPWPWACRSWPSGLASMASCQVPVAFACLYQVMVRLCMFPSMPS